MRKMQKFILPVFIVAVLAACLGCGFGAYHLSGIYAVESSYLDTLHWSFAPTDRYTAIANPRSDGSTGSIAEPFEASDEKYIYLLDPDGTVQQTIEACSFLGEDLYAFSEGSMRGVKNAAGQIVIPANYTAFTAFEDGYAVATDKATRKIIFNKDGEQMWETLTTDVDHLHGPFFVRYAAHSAEIFNVETKEVINSYNGVLLSSVYPINDNVYAVGVTDHRGHTRASTDFLYLDWDLQPVIDETLYSYIGPLSEGKRYVTRCSYTLADIQDEETYYSADQSATTGYMDEEGRILFTLPSVRRANKFSEGLALIYGNDALFAVNERGETVFSLDYAKKHNIKTRQEFYWGNKEEDLPYQIWFTDGIAPVTLDGEHWGYIDKTGTFIVDPIFDSAEPVVNHHAAVSFRGHPGILDFSEVK